MLVVYWLLLFTVCTLLILLIPALWGRNIYQRYSGVA